MSKPRIKAEDFEWRSFPTELRFVSDDGSAPKLTGVAVPYDQEAVLIPAGAMFDGSPEIREVISPGAFTKSLRESEQWALWAHDTNVVLGRKGNGTLRFADTPTALHTEIFPPDTPFIRDAVIGPVKRGDVNGMSFAFVATRKEKEIRDRGKVIVFRVKEAGIMEVSPTPFPVYTATRISARSQQRIDEVLEELGQTRQSATQSAPDQMIHPDGNPEETPTPVAEQTLALRHLGIFELLGIERERPFRRAA